MLRLLAKNDRQEREEKAKTAEEAAVISAKASRRDNLTIVP